MTRFHIMIIALLTGLLWGDLWPESASAQGTPAQRRPKPPTAPGAVKSLDIQAEKLEADFLNGLGDLAKSYEEAGDMQKCTETLELILKLRPDAESVKSKLKELEESVFAENELTVDVDASKNWTAAGVIVGKGLAVRLAAAGTYKFIINEDVGPQGFNSEDALRDSASEFPIGSLIGMIAPLSGPQRGDGNADRKDRDKPEPFLIGTQKELKPEAAGMLFLKLNVPPTARCIGKIKVKLNGNFRKVAG